MDCDMFIYQHSHDIRCCLNIVRLTFYKNVIGTSMADKFHSL